MYQLQTFGGLSLRGESGDDTGTQRRRLALLALLAAAGVRGLTRDQVLAVFWPESPLENARHALEQLLYSLRRQLEEELFLGPDPLRLNSESITSDVAEFEHALGTGALEDAVRLYTGPFLDGFYLTDAAEFERWKEEERARRAAQYGRALEALAQAAAKQGLHTREIDWRRKRASMDPLDGRLALALLRALAAAGDRPGALRHARMHEALVRQELESPADPAVTGFIEQLRATAPDIAETAPGKTAVSASPPPAQSIAVLPFVNLSADPDNEYFGDGLAEELLNLLSRISGLRVAARTSSFAFKGTQTDLRKIAQALNVQHVLEGSIRKAGNRIRVSAHLSNAADGYDLWSARYDRELRQVFEIQDEIAQTIVSALQIRLTGDQANQLTKRGTANPEAYNSYLKGRHHWNKRYPSAIRTAVEHFQQAVDKDPGYALAYTGLADCYGSLGQWECNAMRPHDAWPKSAEAARRALELDQTSAEAHTSMADYHLHYEWNWTAADRCFERALALSPAYSTAHHWFSHCSMAQGRVEQSLALSRRCLELDPLDLVANAHLVWHYWFARQPDEAIEQGWKTRELFVESFWSEFFLGLAYEQKGLLDDATAHLQKALTMADGHTFIAGALGHAWAVAGDRKKASEELRRLEGEAAHRYVPAYDRAVIYAGLNDRDLAFEWLERAYDERSAWIAYLAVEPRLDVLRGDGRFEELLRRVGLPSRSLTAQHR